MSTETQNHDMYTQAEQGEAMRQAQLQQIEALYGPEVRHGYVLGRFDYALEQAEKARARVDGLLNESKNVEQRETEAQEPILTVGHHGLREVRRDVRPGVRPSGKATVHND